VLLVSLTLVGAPAVALHAFCVGKSCNEEAEVAAAVPFCSLPADLRAQIVDGYREGRSPDVLAVTNTASIRGWPASPYVADSNRVPLWFFGSGVEPGPIPAGSSVDQIAPTLAAAMGFDRAHPEVRSGRPLPSVVRNGAAPRLIVEVVWSDVGSDFPRGRAPWLLGTLEPSGEAAFGDATTGSLPTDPAAILTSIGTGGIPSEHGITGTTIRSKAGDAAAAWSGDAPTSVIATLADDWDHATGERARIGLIAPDATSQGMVGGSWYLEHDEDDLLFGKREPVDAASTLINEGFGADETTDILAVDLHGGVSQMDARSKALVSIVRDLVPDTTFVLTATGTQRPTSGKGTPSVSAGSVTRHVDDTVGARVVAAAVPGGLFLDQAVMAANDITSDNVVRAMDAMAAPDGTPLFADAYPGFAISFSRYC
jgi:hypothetical protein